MLMSINFSNCCCRRCISIKSDSFNSHTINFCISLLLCCFTSCFCTCTIRFSSNSSCFSTCTIRFSSDSSCFCTCTIRFSSNSRSLSSNSRSLSSINSCFRCFNAGNRGLKNRLPFLFISIHCIFTLIEFIQKSYNFLNIRNTMSSIDNGISSCHINIASSCCNNALLSIITHSNSNRQWTRYNICQIRNINICMTITIFN